MGSISVDVLIVAGGGGGGANGGGGGGAGGLQEFSGLSITTETSFPVTVGAGGATATGASQQGGNGGNSSVNGLTSIGGGGGGGYLSAGGKNGGSGGGAPESPGGSFGIGTPGQGNNGGQGYFNGGLNHIGGGGGGGAGAVGGNGTLVPAKGGDGGVGISSSISGVPVFYAGGGGGAGYAPGGFVGGAGGNGGGGAGGTIANGMGTAGTANTGGGGGGAPAGGAGVSGAGGSGVVIIRYLTADVSAPGTGGIITNAGGYTIHTFTADGTFVSPSVAVPQITGLAVDSTTMDAAQLSWDLAAAPTDTVLLYWNTVDVFASATLSGAVPATETSGWVAGLAPGTLYYFWAVGLGPGGEIAPESDSASGTTQSAVVPGQPTDLAAVAIGSRTIELTWTDGADTDLVEVLQNTVNNSATATSVGTVLGGVETYRATGLDQDTLYYFWVRPFNEYGAGTLSAVASATTLTQPLMSVTGKAALFYSVNKWLEANVPPADAADFVYSFLQTLAPATMPRIEVTEFPYVDPGDGAFGGVIYPAAEAGQQTEGRPMAAMLEVNIYTDGSKQADALMKLRQLRDRIVYGLVNAGESSDATNVEILPPIQVLDPFNADFFTGIIARVPTETEGAVVENYFKPQAPETLIHRYQLLFRLEWYEMRN